jgi:potassium-transporting ATPase KdpC subunit
MKTQLRPALLMLLAISVLTGLLYPLAVTGIAQVLFRDQARGSVIVRNGHAVGSRLIGQSFTAPGYFWGRPSATAAFPYDASSSSGSNLGPLNPALLDAVRARVAALRAADPAAAARVPVDLVTASGSGLDPHLSLAAADYQVGRVARARGLTPDAVRALVARHTLQRPLGILGEPVVSVLELNLALDEQIVGRAP